MISNNSIPVVPSSLLLRGDYTPSFVPITKPNNFLDDGVIEVYFYGACGSREMKLVPYRESENNKTDCKITVKENCRKY